MEVLGLNPNRSVSVFSSQPLDLQRICYTNGYLFRDWFSEGNAAGTWSQLYMDLYLHAMYMPSNTDMN